MPRLPFPTSNLPDDVQALLTEAVEDEWYEEVLEALEGLADGQATRSPTVLLALAHCLHQDAVTCLVDDIEAYSERALRLVDEAIIGGADGKRLSSWRGRIEASLRRARHERQRIAGLFDVPLESIAEADLREVARHLPDGEPYTEKKLVLYRRIEQLERERASRGEPGNPLWYRACQAQLLARLHRWDQARPLWDEVLAAGTADWHWVLAAHGSLLLEAVHRGDARLFVERWPAALAARDTVVSEGNPPSGMPPAFGDQDQVLAFVLEHRLLEPVPELVEMIRDRQLGDIGAPVQALLDQADRLLAG